MHVPTSVRRSRAVLRLVHPGISYGFQGFGISIGTDHIEGGVVGVVVDVGVGDEAVDETGAHRDAQIDGEMLGDVFGEQ